MDLKSGCEERQRKRGGLGLGGWGPVNCRFGRLFKSLTGWKAALKLTPDVPLPIEDRDSKYPRLYETGC